jgi:molybdopterin-containing oxidoreductase family iron-sulfur binding subunit
MGICDAVRTEIADYSRGPLFEAQFHLEPHILDGRYANNGWLQELPKPWTRLTWDNAALLSPRAAGRLGVRNEDVVEIKVREQAVLAPVWIVPGHPDTGVTLHVGYGRRKSGRVGDGVGVDVYPLRTTGHFWSDRSVNVRPTGERLRLACTQDHHSMEGRHLVREGTLTQFVRNPEFVHEMAHHVPDVTLYPPDHEYEGYSWGMAVDLSACTGCNACVVACNAENNIPVVGKDQVLRGREMHWLRIDRYFEGNLDAPRTVQQPVMCQQCENAPCEPVCPVGATMHSAEGLNDMVYNRCVGTRYCSNNCPYKVRRFNFYMYSDLKTESLKMLRNPDVTVRTRGVMEKCTYCVQRINVARIHAKKEGRTLKDGDVVTACQQSCPTEALVFGNLNDPGSRVSRLRASKLNYRILEDLNTRARTSYLARLRNPNPGLETVETASHGH